ncbi:hypothetical protein H8B09_15940 [Paenibacillus sp. PR3]|uniref:Uncharacterized protein n=1 Tax=Paenibacillus terricola TaxID=2763503 RepID=A0ABR8MWB1_9BACL|nr:hypothetical protein [Paenibacillus terricola]MBD3920258.1 hypothetical protein [Paenibacillus terricola]
MSNLCTKCGGAAFAEGVLGSGHANVKDVDKNLSIGKQVYVTYCNSCGEVASMRVELK